MLGGLLVTGSHPSEVFSQPFSDRLIHHKMLLFIKYVYGQEIFMHKSPILITPWLKAGAHCWEADVNGAKLRNPFPPNQDLELVIEMSQKAHGLTCL